MAIGRLMPPLILDDTERGTPERWVRRPKTAQALALRARMILGCAEGRSNTAVGADLGVSDETVGKWRSRFLERRLDGLSDEPRSGRPRAVTDDYVERVITLTLETTPRDATHWGTQSMAQRCGLSHNTLSRIWRAFGLQPYCTEAFKRSFQEPVFIDQALPNVPATKGVIKGDAYLHRSKTPLVKVDFDRLTSYDNLMLQECEGLCGI